MSHDLGARLKRLRTERKLRQADLAELAKMSMVQYGRYERGTSYPTAEPLSRLASALGVSSDYLLSGAEDDRPPELVLEDRALLEKFRQLKELPERDRKIVEELIDAFVIRRKIRDIAAS